MNRLRRFTELPPPRRRMLLQALLVLWGMRLGLWLIPFQTLRRLLTRMAQEASKPQESEEVFNHVSWAVTATSRFVPRATCLTKALATQFLLSRRGQEAHLRIGVAKTDEGRLEAHAWVESQGRIVPGDSADPSHFAALFPVHTRRP